MKVSNIYKKGINLGGWLSQCDDTKEHYDSFITESDIKNIASLGLDHVRLPFDYELVQNDDGTYKEDGFKYIDNCINWCIKYGLNIILDLHKANGYVFDDFINGGSEDSIGLFSNDELKDKFIDLWVTIANRYKDITKISIAFELLNEIVGKDSSKWNSLAETTVKSIRKILPATDILIGGIMWNSISTLNLLDTPYDNHIIYNFHFYDPHPFTHQKAYWMDAMPKDITTHYPGDIEHYKKISREIGQGSGSICSFSGDTIDKSFLKSLIKDASKLADERNVSLYCGEYGVIDKAPVEDTLRWYKDFHSIMEEYNIGRAAWSYKEMDFGIIEDHYKDIFDELIQCL